MHPSEASRRPSQTAEKSEAVEQARSYALERSTTLSTSSGFTQLGEIPGQAGTTAYTDTTAAELAPIFYRLRIR